MKKINMVSVVQIDGIFKVSYSYDEADDSGVTVAQNKRGSFDASGSAVTDFMTYVSKNADKL